MRVDGHVIPVGDCAGIFLVPAQQVTVQVGQQIDVRMTEEPAGPSGNQLIPVFPLPRSSRPVVLADGTVSQDRASGTYRAIRPGHAVLTTRAWCLVGSGEIRGSCPDLDDTVVPYLRRGGFCCGHRPQPRRHIHPQGSSIASRRPRSVGFCPRSPHRAWHPRIVIASR